MKKYHILCLIGLMVTFVGLSERASALSIDYSNALVDKAGLQWLSPTYSTGLSYQSMYENLMPNHVNEFTGLRFATWKEVDSLASAYGGIGPGATQTIASQSEIDAFLIDFECGSSFLVDGYVGTPTNGNPILTLMDSIENPMFYVYGGEIRYLRDVWPMSMDGEHYFPSWNRGWWLVTQEPAPIPEPSTILLLGFGLIGLGAYKRRRQE